ncbi:MAG: hypothetical protein WA877_05670, partial [Legionella sp.]
NYTLYDKRHLTKFIFAPFLFLYFAACFAINALGRGISNRTTPKHNIKKVDSLIGNKKLHKERDGLYSYVA